MNNEHKKIASGMRRYQSGACRGNSRALGLLLIDLGYDGCVLSPEFLVKTVRALDRLAQRKDKWDGDYTFHGMADHLDQLYAIAYGQPTIPRVPRVDWAWFSHELQDLKDDDWAVSYGDPGWLIACGRVLSWVRPALPLTAPTPPSAACLEVS